MPKRGFIPLVRERFAEINIDTLANCYTAGAKVDKQSLLAKGLASRSDSGVRILGRGDISIALTVVADHFSASAKEKIQKAGGTVVEPTDKAA